MPEKYITSKLIKLAVIIAVCLLLIFLNPKGIFSPVRQVFTVAVYPFQKTFYILSRKTRETFDFLVSISELKKENERLLKENNSLSARTALVEQEKRENENLREQLGLIPRSKFNLESSFIIGQDPQKLGSWISIDKGSFSGIQSGMPVIVSDGILVGRVEEVFGNTSRVNLLTSPSSSVSVIDLESGAKGVIRGEFGLGVIMDMVNQTDILSTGDSIVTSGLSGDVPKGLLVGKIQSFSPTDDKLFQKATISPRVKYSNLDVVFVIKNNK
jgi:rod shape-determining protein MreC